MFLISNWKTILGVVATAALAYLLHTVDVDRLEAQQRQAVADQVNADTKSCNADKAITQGVSHDYETKITGLTAQLNDLQRVRPNVCVTIAPHAAGGHDATTGTSKPANTHGGVDSDALYALAAEGERYRLQLSACQDFITQTWKEKGQ